MYSRYMQGQDTVPVMYNKHGEAFSPFQNGVFSNHPYVFR